MAAIDESIVLETHRLMMEAAQHCRKISKCFEQMVSLGTNPYYDLPGYGSQYFARDFLLRAEDMERDANEFLENHIGGNNAKD